MGSERSGFSFTLNGGTVRVEGLAPQTTLLDYLRERGLTGSKEGCAEGECGSCAVLLVKQRAKGRHPQHFGQAGTPAPPACYVAVNSCLVPLPAAADQEVLTVEGLAQGGELTEVQRAMVEKGGSQCGYCTPGFVISLFAEQYRPDEGPRDPDALSGNLCRCTGYRPIGEALLSLDRPPSGTLRNRLDRPAPGLAPFSYSAPQGRFSRPACLTECLDLLASDPSARILAGNTDLGVETNLRGRRFAHLISIEALPELHEFIDGPESVEMGAGLTLTEIAERWSSAPEVFSDWLGLFASRLIRNGATLGGNLATASPIGDSAPLLLALNASLRIVSREDERTVPLSSFFRGYRQTDLQPGELIRSVLIPKPWPNDARFYKVAKRSLDDISTVAAAFALWRDGAGRVTSARVAFGGVAAVPLRALGAEAALTGSAGDPQAFDRAAQLIHREITPISDHRGSAAYRLALAESLVRKFQYDISLAEVGA